MTSLPWFRLYHRMIDDDKLRLLAFEDRWHFVALCCLKADGLLDEPDSDIRSRRIAVKLGVQLRELDEIKRRLGEVQLIDENMCPLSWDKLQFSSDTSTARVKKYRENKRLDVVKQSETLQKRSSNALDTDTDTDTDTEAKASCASGDTQPQPVDGDEKIKPEHIAEHWNDLAARIGKPRVQKLTPERRQLLRSRIAQYSIDEFVEVFGNVERSPFLRGDKDWQGCCFDWVFKKTNFQKILEGNYNE